MSACRNGAFWLSVAERCRVGGIGMCNAAVLRSSSAGGAGDGVRATACPNASARAATGGVVTQDSLK